MNVPDISSEFTAENFSRLVHAFNTAFRNVSLENNFSAQIVGNITLPAGAEVRIPHSLKTVPKYRILLRQDSTNALITDGVGAWTSNYITLANKGGSDTIITVMIFRR